MQDSENHTLLSGTYPFRPNKGVSPPPNPPGHIITDSVLTQEYFQVKSNIFNCFLLITFYLLYTTNAEKATNISHFIEQVDFFYSFSTARAALLTGRLPIRNGFYTTNDHARNGESLIHSKSNLTYSLVTPPPPPHPTPLHWHPS